MISRTNLLILAALSFFSGMSVCMAQSFIQSSSGQDVAFSFYKTADATPNYDRWIKNSDPYLSTPQAKWRAVMISQREFLKTAFKSYDPNQDLIVVKSKARVKLDRPDNPETDPMLLTFRFRHERDNRELFFPFEYGGDHFAVIVDDLDELRTAEIRPKEVPYVNSQLTNREVTVVLRLAPVSADINTPYMMEDAPYWLLGTKVASLSLWNREGNIVYEHIAPWYFSPATEDISKLKTKQEEIQDLLDIEIDPILMPIENP